MDFNYSFFIFHLENFFNFPKMDIVSIRNIYIYFFFFLEGAYVVMVIVVGNGHVNTSLNPGLHFA